MTALKSSFGFYLKSAFVMKFFKIRHTIFTLDFFLVRKIKDAKLIWKISVCTWFSQRLF